MRKRSTLTSILAILFLTVAYSNGEDLNRKVNERCLRFTENKGQVADKKGNLRPDVLFMANNAGVKLFINHTGISYQFTKVFKRPQGINGKNLPSKLNHREIDSTQTYRMDMQLVGANTHAAVLKENEGEDYENFFLVHCPNGIIGVKNFGRITYQNIYPDIDWVLYSKNGKMEYDFVVKPGGDPKQIKIKYKDVGKIELKNDGSMLISNLMGEVKENKPLSYQGSVQVENHFTYINNTISFDVKRYDHARTLTIDPILAWATYYGGSSTDEGYATCTDIAGNVYLGGMTVSNSGIASSGFQNIINGNTALFLVKFNSAGNRLWATYYGGNQYSVDGCAICTDTLGNVFLAAGTNDTVGIASNGFQNSFISTGGVTNGFLVKFNSSGNRLWATYYGGSTYTSDYSVCTDLSGNVYMAGSTQLTSGVASGGFQNTYGGSQSAFLAKFNSSGNRIWGTYYGYGNTFGQSVCSDQLGNVFLSGYTNSTTGIASGGYQNIYGGNGNGAWNAFLVKFNNAGNRLWGTYYGGANGSLGYATCADAAGNVYLAGNTYDSTNIASGGFQNTIQGQEDAFLVKFNSAGNRLWGTYYNIDALALCTDRIGNVYLAGETPPMNGISSLGLQNSYGGGLYDAFLVKFSTAGSRMWASYYGGTAPDAGSAVCADTSGYVYLAGRTGSSSNISSGGFQNTIGGIYDAFLAKIYPDCDITYDTIKLQLCNNISSYVYRNRSFAVPGSYYATFSQAYGCDTVASLYLTHDTFTTIPLNLKFCNNITSYQYNGHTFTVPGSYLDTLTNTCDSIVHLVLTHYPLYNSSIIVIDSACENFPAVLSAYYNGPVGSIASYHWSNNSNSLQITTSALGNYYITITDTNGCAAVSTSMPLPVIANCAGKLIVVSDSIVNYFDTVHVSIYIKEADNLFSIFAKLNFDASHLELISSTVGDFLGTNVINQPAIATGGTIDFGMTEISGASGISGDGLVYSFLFKVKTLPQIMFNDTVPTTYSAHFNLQNAIINDATGLQRHIGLIGDTTLLRYYIPVWPGDLNNDHTVNVADILPIGYFYNKTGPVRPNASLQWAAQPAPFWATDASAQNRSAYQVFADGNGNGIIDLADQNSIGFNLGRLHALPPHSVSQQILSRSSTATLQAYTVETQVDSTQLPYSLNVSINLGSQTNPADSVLGIAFDLDFDAECIDTNLLTASSITYTNLFGTYGTNFTAISDLRYKSQGRVSIGMTRYGVSSINAYGDSIVNIKFTLINGCYGGWFRVKPYLLACDSADGGAIPLSVMGDSVKIVATQPTHLAIRDVQADDIVMYPNPANTTIHIYGTALKNNYTIAITNALNQLVYKQPYIVQEIDISMLNSGIYYISINNGLSDTVKKLVVVR